MSPSSFRSLHQVARLALPLANAKRVPFAASSHLLAPLRRHKATQVAPLSTAAGGHLPFYVNWIGSYLGSSLNREQLNAFAARYLPLSGDATENPGASSDADGVAAMQRERDAAVAKVSSLEAAAAELRSQVAKMESKVVESTSGAEQLAVLRAKLKAAESETADLRIELNPLKEKLKNFAATSATSAETSAARRSDEEAERIEKMVAAAASRAAAEAMADAEAAAEAAARKAEDDKARAVAEVRARSREDLDRTVKASRDAVASALARAEGAESAAAAAKTTESAAASIAGTAPRTTHPIYGSLLHDFGYKKVYAMPAAHLVSKDKVAVFEQQRAFRAERAEVIAKEKAKEATFSIPGVISIAEGTASVKTSSANGRKGAAAAAAKTTVSILDGQHRVGALDILLEKKVLAANHEVLVEVFPNVDDEKAVGLFMEINSAQPIRFVDLPGVTTPDVKWMLEGAVQRLKDQYPTMFSESARCKIPNVNLDNLREELFSAEIHSRFNISTEFDFVAWLLSANQRLAARSDDDWLARRPAHGRGAGGSTATYRKALAKARDTGFYLGMDFTWLDVDEDGEA